MQTSNTARYPTQPIPALQHTAKITLALLALTCAIFLLATPPQLQGPSPEPLTNTNPAQPTQLTAPPIKSNFQDVFDGQRCYRYLKTICDFGSRMSGSPGMKRQQKYLEKHFTDLGAKVSYQPFKWKHPLTGKRVPMNNLIVEWRPEAKERILLCAHYDTRPLPDQELNFRLRREGVFLGANDGASGVAALMELGHHVQQLPNTYGIDFVLFDGEELVYDDNRDPYFLGSTWFADRYAKRPPKHKYIAGVLLDMVADAKLTIYQEKNSLSWPKTRRIVNEIWATAQRLGVKEFIPRAKYVIRDDHLPLNQIAKIPVCDIIDFEYPDPSNRYWHTTRDSPEHCSAESLGKVGWVVLEWLATRR